MNHIGWKNWLENKVYNYQVLSKNELCQSGIQEVYCYVGGLLYYNLIKYIESRYYV